MSVTRIAALLIAALTLALAGCGGDDDNAEAWAGDVCSNLNEWVDDVDAAVNSLSGQGLSLGEDDIRSAVDDAVSATDELVEDLQDLGPPDTEAGDAARNEIGALATQLQTQSETVERAVDAGGQPLQLVQTVAGAVSASLTALNETIEGLQNTDAGDELSDAFQNSEDCDSLQERVAELRS